MDILGDECEDSENEQEEGLNDEKLYFGALKPGEAAYDKFWDFYKSDRKFKDFDYKNKVEDPRQAYFDTCTDLKVYPQAKLIIRDEKSNIIEYRNVSLLNKSSKAVAQALARYQVPIEKVVFFNNGMKHEESILLMTCLKKHYANITTLCISRNKIGIEGVKCINEGISHMKNLQILDLSHDEIGDQGIHELIQQLELINPNLEELNLSGNHIGKNYTYFEKYADLMIKFF